MEVERKYLLSALPPREILGRGVEIRQGYIDAADPEIRVRQKGPALFLTIKSGAGLQRQECEVQIPAATFDKLWPLTEGRRVVKTRHVRDAGGAVLELDRYDGDLDGLVTLEVELPDVAAAEAFTPPDWAGVAQRRPAFPQRHEGAEPEAREQLEGDEQ